MKKTLEELEKIRNTTIEQINIRTGKVGYKVAVGMATCGIAAGSRSIVLKFMDQLEKYNLTSVTIAQIGCIGQCENEPIVEVHSPDGEKVVYIKMDVDKVERVVEEHLKNGKIIYEYTTT